jgi:hypothetical protein
MDGLSQQAELAVSELVTNAVRASLEARQARQAPDGPPAGLPVIALRLAGDHKRLLVEVSDHDSHPPVPTLIDPERDGGRGLVLVEAVSERWGYYYPATDPLFEGQGPIPASGDNGWLAAPPVLPAGDREPGKVVWALLSPP